ncbi:MAG: CPBP family intramembrane glutamic endopeptidase [Planctomycetota bacterium]
MSRPTPPNPTNPQSVDAGTEAPVWPVYAACPAPPTPTPPKPLKPWGPWATLGLLLASVAIGIVLTIPIGIAWLLVDSISRNEITPGFAPEDTASMFAMEMTVVAASQFGMLGGVVFFAWLRRPVSLRSYFALRPVGWRTLGWGLLAIVGVLGFEMVVSWLRDAPVPESVAELMRYPQALPLVWLIVVLVAPLCEEAVFRGFMWRGLIDTRLGLHGTVVVTCLPWTLLHLGQYDLAGMLMIFISGLTFGYARHLSASLWVPMFMHFVMNLVAMTGVTILWSTGQL